MEKDYKGTEGWLTKWWYCPSLGSTTGWNRKTLSLDPSNGFQARQLNMFRPLTGEEADTTFLLSFEKRFLTSASFATKLEVIGVNTLVWVKD
jgi:hypothetical protein